MKTLVTFYITTFLAVISFLAASGLIDTINMGLGVI